MAGKEKENPLNYGIKKLKGNGKDVARVGIASAIATDFYNALFVFCLKKNRLFQ